CTAERAGREGGTQYVERAETVLQAPFDIRDDMHHVRVTLHHHLVGERDRTGFGNTANIVASQVDQHQVLGDFLRVSQQLFLKSLVFLGRMATATGAGNRAYRHRTLLDASEDFRRRTGDMEILE